MKRFWIRRAARFLIFGLLFVGLVGLAVMKLWNALLPDILRVSPINFSQALGLLVLSRLLFGGFRGAPPVWGNRGWRGGNSRWGNSAERQDWRQKMKSRWDNLTPEQRTQLKDQLRARCGPRGRWNQGSGGNQSTGNGEPTNL